ncbi:ATP-binding protein, partial [Streptomyces sp. SID9124]|nr:ATP-binding protein [Streptomyces sp. SID9124]
KFGESGLPKRSRGRTLAAAEARARSTAEAARDTGAAADRSPDTEPDPKARAARFSSFRNAVRPDSPHPEGNSR